MMKRQECLETLSLFRPTDGVVVTSMGSAAPWSRISSAPLDFYSVGSAMGHSADFAMGIALAQPNRPVWVFNGDGSMLMCLETLVTICQTPPPNLVLWVLQNDTYEVTGNQPVPGASKFCMTQLARGAGFGNVHELDSADSMKQQLPSILDQTGPIFVNLRIETGEEPAPKLDRPLREHTVEFRKELLKSSN